MTRPTVQIPLQESRRGVPTAIFRALGLATPGVVVLLISIYRCWEIERWARAFLDVRWTVFLAALQSEALSIGAFVLLYGLTLSVHNRWLRAGFAVASGLFAVWMSVDTLVLGSFWKRLDWSDVAAFGGEPRIALDFLRLQLAAGQHRFAIGLVVGAFLLIPFLLAGVATSGSPRKGRRILAGCSSASLLLGVLSLGQPEIDLVIGPYMQSTIQFNLAHGRREAYSPVRLAEVERRLQPGGAEGQKCIDGLGLQKSIVLVVVESLSSYQSKRLSGLNDWLPRFDKLADKGWLFDNFVANGFRTDLGLIATLTGRWPVIPPDKQAKPFLAFHDLPDSLPKRLAQQGYQTLFLSGASLEFLGIQPWLRSIGFQTVVGPDDIVRTDGQEHGLLKAASDEALYAAALRQVEATRNSGVPQFIVLNTISSHIPFADPLTGKPGERVAFDYVDRTLASFEEGLRNAGFFERGGMLVMLGDHRAVTAISGDEYRRFGTSAPARIPLMVLGLARQHREALTHEVHQQSDLAPSLEYINSRKACFWPWQRNLFGPSPWGDACAFHVLGAMPNRAAILCGSGTGFVTLRGDNTALEGISPENSQGILDGIAASSLAHTSPSWSR